MSNTAIIFVHGFMGCHRQFGPLSELLDDGETDMIFHVLPGHESTLEDFRTTNEQVWQESVNELVRKMSESYDRILLVGHSMGGLLAMRAAVAEPKNVIGVAAIGFPIKVSIGPKWFKLMLAASSPEKEGEDPRVTAARNMSGVTIKSIGQYFSTLPQNIQFLKSTRIAQRDLHNLKAPLKVLDFDKDEIVAKSVQKFVMSQKPDAKVVMYPDSYHFYFTPEELCSMADEIRAML